MSAFNGVFGFNINAAGVAGAKGGWQRLYDLIGKLRPAACVLMDFDNKRAVEMKRAFPQMDVILRIPYDGDADYRTITPVQWIERFGAFAADGITLQCLNEPHGYQHVDEGAKYLKELGAWCIDVMRRARSRHIRLCLPNFAVGHPDLSQIASIYKTFDPLLIEFTAGNHILGLHEYAVSSADETHHITRYRAWLQRCADLRITYPKIVITETGRDVGGGYDDGWRKHLSDAKYADLLKSMGAKYASDGVAACIFGYGFDGDGRWHQFDVSFANELLERLVADRIMLNTFPPVEPPKPPPDEWREGFLQLPTGVRALNLRTEPVIVPSTKISEVTDNHPMRYRLRPDGWYDVEFTTTYRGVISSLDGTVTFSDEPDA